MLQQALQRGLEAKLNQKAPLFEFMDNNDLEEYLKLPVQEKYYYRIMISQLDKVFEDSLPNMVKDGQIIKAEASKIKGFWTKLKLTGSQTPCARENATMYCSNYKLTLFGGNVPITGGAPFDVYEADLQTQKWEKVHIENNILTPS